MPFQSRSVQLNKQPFEALQFTEGRVESLFHLLDELDPPYAIPPGELSIAFLGDEAIGQLHGEFLDDPTPTDVITFEGEPELDFAGEICVSVEHALSQSAQFGTTFAEELTLYLIHGWLHLAGFDDLTEAACPAMRAGERHLMELLKSQEAIPDFSIAS